MYNAIVILVVIAAILMCLIVMVQESKGGGLASGFSEMNSLGGVRKTTDIVEKITWSLAAIMVVLSVVSVAFLNDGTTSDSVMVKQATEQTGVNPNNIPALPAGNA